MERRLTFDMFPNGPDERMLTRGDFCDEKTIQSILGTFDEIDEDQTILQNKDAYSAHYLGQTRLYHTFNRRHRAEPYRYAGLCAFGESGNMHPRSGKKTFIISQYHADTDEGMEFNRRFAMALARGIVTEYGDVPIAPHLYFPEFLNDCGTERDFGIEAGHLLMRICDSVLLATIYGRISEGMHSDLEYATMRLGLKPRTMDFTEKDAVEYINEMENDRYEERSRAEHR